MSPFREPEINRATVPAELLGDAVVEPTGRFVAGSWQEFTLVYTAGFYGIDDSGGLRITFRYATDQSPLQLDAPSAPGYTTVEASNGATLACRFDPMGNLRPWGKTLSIRVVKGHMREGDTITVRFGDRRFGSPGLRLQTFCEDTFEFRILLDAVAAYHFLPLAQQPTICIGPGAGKRWRAVLPSTVPANEEFSLRVKVEDEWGNPTDLGRRNAFLSVEGPGSIDGLPERVLIEEGSFTATVDGLSAGVEGHYSIILSDQAGKVLTRSNPMRIGTAGTLRLHWGDIHGQSEETIGTNSAEAYFAFARDKAFLDVTAHQGNDFQITDDFWKHLNELTYRFDKPGRFVAIPGYEWSGNTSLGGDRNVYFAEEGGTIRRSSHALIVSDQQEEPTKCTTANELFKAFRKAGDDVVCVAHCGGRYADVSIAHDSAIETSVEIHSSWGTFEWILQDALRLGYRVGILANSDGHKGRPGASYPGASLFGAVGGLTGYWVEHLDRASIMACLRRRHHFATTGNRMLLSVGATFQGEVEVHHDDPALVDSNARRATSAFMGDIVRSATDTAVLEIEISADSPVLAVELFNGLELVSTRLGYAPDKLGRRIRVAWQGAEYRGRARETMWDGSATVTGNSISAARSFNFFNPYKKFEWAAGGHVAWEALTTGNLSGFDMWLEDGSAGELTIETPLRTTTMAVGSIATDEVRFELGGLDRALRVMRLPEQLDQRVMRLSVPVAVVDGRDNPLYARVTLEDGNVAWSSPIYVYR